MLAPPSDLKKLAYLPHNEAKDASTGGAVRTVKTCYSRSRSLWGATESTGCSARLPGRKYRAPTSDVKRLSFPVVLLSLLRATPTFDTLHSTFGYSELTIRCSSSAWLRVRRRS